MKIMRQFSHLNIYIFLRTKCLVFGNVLINLITFIYNRMNDNGGTSFQIFIFFKQFCVVIIICWRLIIITVFTDKVLKIYNHFTIKYYNCSNMKKTKKKHLFTLYKVN